MIQLSNRCSWYVWKVVGTILVGVFAYYDPYTDADVLTAGGGLGLVYGGGFAQLIVQVIGVVAVAVYVAVVMTIVFQVIKHTVGLRVSLKKKSKDLTQQNMDLHQLMQILLLLQASFLHQNLRSKTC